jgi:TolA-binding protein
MLTWTHWTKATNQKLQKSLLLPLPEERKLNKLFTRDRKKASPMVCLFLLTSLHTIASEADSQWHFDKRAEEAYNLVLNLQFENAVTLLPSPSNAQEHYIVALAEALELLISEDRDRFKEFEDNFNKRLERKTKLNNPADLFLQAELRMQWTFIYLKFGHEFDAALNLRQAYLTLQTLKEKFPRFEAAKKTSGLLNVLIGSVPQKYNWVLALLNMEGSTETGLTELRSISDSNGAFAFEGHLMHALVLGFLLQEADNGLQEIDSVLGLYGNNRLALLLGSALAKKNGQSEKATVFLDSLASAKDGFPLPLSEYLRAEIYLYQGKYLDAISSYRWFISNYRGQNGLKDAYYKVGLCYLLNGNRNDAEATFKIARNVGQEVSEADKHAAQSMADNNLPHVALIKARYATDGGYYKLATEILDSLRPSDLNSKRDRVEINYRRARLAHKQEDIVFARKYYLQTIREAGEETWYYAPNACLQLGYIFLEEGNIAQAKDYFNRALSFNKHEYKNSIDSKAKSALAQIKRK